MSLINNIYYQQKTNIMTHFLSLEQPNSTHSSYQHNPQSFPERALEYRASSSLCQLSDYICVDVNTHREGEGVVKGRVNCSPWRQQKDEMRLQQFLHKMRKKSSIKPLNDHSKILKSLCSKEVDCTNEEIFKPRYPRNQKDQTELKKFPSVFIRLMAAKQTKTQSKQNSQMQMLTILRRKKDGTHSQIKKAVLGQRQDNYSMQVRRSQGAQQQSSSKINHSLVKHNSKYQSQTSPLDGCKLINDSWKIKNIYSKSKSIKRNNLPPSQNKQNNNLPKKYHQQYQSRNPLTKLLYQKYINTISMTHPIKEGRYK